MAKKRRELVLDSNLIKRIVDMEKLGKGMNYIMEWISFMNDTSLFSKNMRIDTLYRTTAPQIVWIEEGEVEGTFNYRMYRLKKGDLLYKPSGTLFSLHSMSENLKARLIDFHIPHAMYGKLLVGGVEIMELPEQDYVRIKSYFDLIHDSMKEREHLSRSIEHLVLALLHNINYISSRMNSKKDIASSRSDVLFGAFMQEVLKERDVFPRSLTFYARRLGVTPNHLGMVVKSVSRKSFQQCINEVSLYMAEDLIKMDHPNMKEVATKTGFKNLSSFCRFFKKQTGMTPGEYRNSQAV